MSSDHHHATLNTNPQTLSTGEYELQSIANPPRSSPNTAQNITPYLGLRARLSQVWVNRWTILLFLVLVRTLLAIVGLNHDLGSAKTEALSACSAVEDMGSAMASMPHYMSAGVNELAASGVEEKVRGLMSMLLFTVTGLEELFVFWVNMMYSTYICLITLVVSSSLHVALQVIQHASDFINSTIKDIGSDISKGINEFQNDFNGFLSKINSVPSVLGGNSKGPPKIDVNSSLDKLSNLQLPSDLDGDLAQLNKSIPDFKDVRNFTDNILRLPFEEVKKLINGSIHFDFNRSAFPVPQKEQLTFCSGNNGISDFFDDLAKIIMIARRTFIAILVILAILACIPMAYQEIRRWRTMQDRAKLVGDNSLDPVDVIYIASRPYTATAGIKAASPLRSSKGQTLVRWVIAYVTSGPALFVLSLGITGLFACLCQYILLKAVEKEVPALANGVGDFAGKVVTSLNKASQAWADGTNGAITHVNKEINHDVFGWVNTTTGAVNNTLNAFVDNTTSVLNKTFGNTILYEPITGLFECLVGLKIASVQKGLTWASDHAQVSFPLLPNDTFSLGAAASIGEQASSDPGASNNASDSFLASPGSANTDKITNAVVKVTNHIAEGIRTEAIISTCLILIWLILFLLATSRAIYLNYRPDKLRGEGGPEPTTKPQRPFMSIIRGPAPAYEPPVLASSTEEHRIPASTRGVSNFNRPVRNTTVTSASTRRTSMTDLSSVDEKAGYAGFHEPAVVEQLAHEHYGPGRRSVYPTVEKS